MTGRISPSEFVPQQRPQVVRITVSGLLSDGGLSASGLLTNEIVQDEFATVTRVIGIGCQIGRKLGRKSETKLFNTDNYLSFAEERAIAVVTSLPALFPSTVAPPKKLGNTTEALLHVLKVYKFVFIHRPGIVYGFLPKVIHLNLSTNQGPTAPPML